MTIREMLEQQNSDALFYPERFDPALVGMTFGFRAYGETKAVAVYDYQELVNILAAEFAKDAELEDEQLEERDFPLEAEEWVDINMAGAYLGPDAPVIVIAPE
jgi:hypothetical protein